MALNFYWLYDVCFRFIGKVLGLISYLASTSYDVIMPLFKNFFANNHLNALVQFTNIFTGGTEEVFLSSTLPRVFNAVLNLVNQVVWWLLNLVARVFQLNGQPFVFTIFAVFALFFIPFFGFRFVRMIIG